MHAAEPRLVGAGDPCDHELRAALIEGNGMEAMLDVRRQFQVVPVAAPSEEERAHPYLWRFWRQLPRLGHVTIFDRSWYGRVLVERIEKLCADEDWLRAYAEINDFESELMSAGVIVLKFWLQITEDEQLRRFKGREQVEHKRFKITSEDWRTHGNWAMSLGTGITT